MTQPDRDPIGETLPSREADSAAETRSQTEAGGGAVSARRVRAEHERGPADAEGGETTTGAPAATSGDASAPPKRKRRRRRRKKSRADEVNASPAVGSTSVEKAPVGAAQSPADAQPAVTTPTEPAAHQAGAESEGPGEDSPSPTAAPKTKIATDDASSDDSSDAPREASSDVSSNEAPAPMAPATPTSKDLSRGERSLEFCKQHSAELQLEASALPEHTPTSFEQLASVDQLMTASRLETAAASLEPARRRQFLLEALVAAPTLDRFNLCLKHDTSDAGLCDAPKLLELLRRLDVDDTAHVLAWAQLVEHLVPKREHIEWLLVASENKSLRRVLDAERRQLAETWRPLLDHARTLHAVIVRGQTNQWGARALHQAVRSLLRSKADTLHQRAPVLRQRFLDLALDLDLDKLETATVERHLDALEPGEDTSRLALRQVSSWLARGRFSEARTRLEKLANKLPDRPEPGKWLKALAAPHFGDIALIKSRIKPPLAIKQALRPGFALREQADVWLRVGSSSDALAFQEHAEVHRRAEIPSVTPLRYFGITRERRPYAAFARQGDNAKFALTPARGLSYPNALQHAEQLLRLAYGLARAGVVLPDADLGRLELSDSGQLWLVETWGIKSAAADVAQERGLGVAREWMLTLLDGSPHFELTEEQKDNLRHAADFATMRAVVDSLGRVYVWGG